MEMLWKLFFSFFRTGIFGFGGGQATIPLIQEEVVDKFGWLTDEQFIDYLAMGNTLPGPIATKMSVIIGFDLAGYPGAFFALLGMLLPSTVAILVLFSFFEQYKNTAFVKGMQAAAKPVVVMLIAGVALSMARTGVFAGIDFATSKTWIVLGLFVVSGVIVVLNEYVPGFSIHPALVIIVSILIGGFFIR